MFSVLQKRISCKDVLFKNISFLVKCMNCEKCDWGPVGPQHPTVVQGRARQTASGRCPVPLPLLSACAPCHSQEHREATAFALLLSHRIMTQMAGLAKNLCYFLCQAFLQ